MRTAIFVGLLYVGDAIGAYKYSDLTFGFLLIVLIGAIVMDIWEFVKNISNKKI